MPSSSAEILKKSSTLNSTSMKQKTLKRKKLDSSLAKTPITPETDSEVEIDSEVSVKVSTPIKRIRSSEKRESKSSGKRSRLSEKSVDTVETGNEQNQEDDEIKEGKDFVKIPSENSAPKLPRSEVAKNAKNLRKERRGNKPNAGQIEMVKPLWEELRKKDLSKEDREELYSELFTKLLGAFLEVASKHDGARIVETMIKYGTKEQKTSIVKELSGHFVELSKGKYSKFIVSNLMKTFHDKNAILDEFIGKMAVCLKHGEASSVVNVIYSDCCTLKQRNTLVLEFYGKEFALFKKNYEGLSLEDILAKDPSKKNYILGNLRFIIDELLKKGNLHHSIFHRLLKDYIKFSEATEEFMQWIDELVPHLKQMIHTMDGVLACLQVLSLGSAKTRKRFVKSLYDKEGSLTNDLPKVISDQCAHIALMGVFSLVDDTVLINDTLVKELCKDFASKIENRTASQLILFILAGGRSTRYLTPQVFKALEEAERRSSTSKKPMDVRISQIRAAIEPEFAKYAKGKVLEMIFDQCRCNLLSEFIHLEAGREAIEELLEEVKKPITCSEHFIYKDLFRQFMKRLAKRGSDELNMKIFSAMEPQLEKWLEHDTRYIIVAMAQSSKSVLQKVESMKNKSLLEAIKSTKSHQDNQSNN